MKWPELLAELDRPDIPEKMNWPNFLVVGPHKTGSTSMNIHLRRHPDIFLPQVKHACPFQPENISGDAPARCRALYAGARDYKAIGEVNPDYFLDAAVPERVRQVTPGARIVITLRDPVERAYSHYLTARYTNPDCGDPARSFREVLTRYQDRSSEFWWRSREYVEYSLYYEPVRRYVEAFGRDQIIFPIFDDFVKNPNEVLVRIARHIGVDPAVFADLDVFEDGNPFRTPKIAAVRWGQRVGLQRLLPHSLKIAMRPLFFKMKKPPLDEDLRRELQALYDPDLTRLEDLLGRKLPELRKSWI